MVSIINPVTDKSADVSTSPKKKNLPNSTSWIDKWSKIAATIFFFCIILLQVSFGVMLFLSSQKGISSVRPSKWPARLSFKRLCKAQTLVLPIGVDVHTTTQCIWGHNGIFFFPDKANFGHRSSIRCSPGWTVCIHHQTTKIHLILICACRVRYI